MAPATACSTPRQANFAAAIPALPSSETTPKGDEIHVKISTLRHNPDPGFKPLFGTDMITLTLKGSENGDMVDFEGDRAATARRRLQGGADADRRLTTQP